MSDRNRPLVLIRLPDKKLKADIQRIAKASNRSMTQEVVTALQAWVASQKR